MTINRGIHNKSDFKAVPCDLRAKLRELKDVLVRSGEASKDDFGDYFDTLDVCPMSIGSAISLLECYGADIDEGSTMIDLAVRKEHGVLVLPNDVEVILVESYSDTSEHFMIQALYYDGDKLRLFTPYAGNWVNVAYDSFLGDESEALEIDAELYRRVYGVDYGTENVALYDRYLQAFDVKGFSLNYNLIEEEIKSVLSDV